MTAAMMIVAIASAYCAGLATAFAIQAHRAKLAAPIPPAWLPQTAKVELPPKASAPPTRSPFAPQPKPKPVEPPPKHLLHWPRADAWAERNLSRPAEPPTPRPPSASLLPHNEL